MKNIKWEVVNFIVACTVSSFLTIASAGEVQDRIDNQENRIDQGVSSGQLTPKETARLQAREARIEKERLNDLKNNNGELTPQEYHQLNRQENRESGSIYRKKHNQETDTNS